MNNNSNVNTFPIHSKSPLISSKQSHCLPNGTLNSLRMSDQNEYIKPKKELFKITNSQSSSSLIHKKSQLESTNGAETITFAEENAQKNKDFLNSCAKHPKKKAKYYNKEENSNKIELFCSKCALDLAIKGIKVEKFLNKEEKYRKNIIEEFLFRIKETKAYSNQIKANLSNQKNENLAIQAFRIESIKEFFTNLEAFFRNEKNNILTEFQINFSINCPKMEKELNNIQNITIEIDRFQDDINQNYTKIINKMDLEPFLDIMQKYNEKLKFLRDSLQMKENLLQEVQDFRKPCQEFFGGLRSLIRHFLGINSKNTSKTALESLSQNLLSPNSEILIKENASFENYIQKKYSETQKIENKLNCDDFNLNQNKSETQKIEYKTTNGDNFNLKKHSETQKIEHKINCDDFNQKKKSSETQKFELKPNCEDFNKKKTSQSQKIELKANYDNFNQIKSLEAQELELKANYEDFNDKKPLEIKKIEHKQNCEVFYQKKASESQKIEQKSSLNNEFLKDKTLEILNHDNNSLLRKTSFSKETQDKILHEFSSNTQRNPLNNEHIYSSILNHMNVKKGNIMKGCLSGVGKNFKSLENKIGSNGLGGMKTQCNLRNTAFHANNGNN